MARIHMKKTAVFIISVLSVGVLVLAAHSYRKSAEQARQIREETELWMLLKEQARTTVAVPITERPPPEIHVKKLPSLSVNPSWAVKMLEHTFFKYLENKDIRCQNDIRIGNWHDGGWNVCLSPPFKMADPCVVFSFGIANDWQFDDAISTMYGCRVLAFDPSITELGARRSPLIEFRKVGVGPFNTINKQGWKMKTLGTHLRDEGYWGEPVDYVKLDIEFSEWSVLDEAFKDDGTFSYIKQLGIEIHTPDLFNIYSKDQVSAAKDVNSDNPLAAFFEDAAVRPNADKSRVFVHMFEALHRLEILGFRKFNYRKNPFGNFRSNISGIERSCCYELHYINTNFLDVNDTILHYRDDKIFH